MNTEMGKAAEDVAREIRVLSCVSRQFFRCVLGGNPKLSTVYGQCAFYLLR